MYIEWTDRLVETTIRKALDLGEGRGFPIACAIVDEAGRPRGALRHTDAGFMTFDFALGKAKLAASSRHSTGATYERLQRERPLYGASLAGLNSRHDFFLVEGGAPIFIQVGGKKRCIGGLGISGCFPAALDQEIADAIVEALVKELA